MDDKVGIKALESINTTEEEFMDGLSALASIMIQELRLRKADTYHKLVEKYYGAE